MMHLSPTQSNKDMVAYKFLSLSTLFTTKAKTSINHLPEELIIRIFSFLSPQEVNHAQSVCQNWEKIGNKTALWDRLYRRDFKSKMGEKKTKQDYIGRYKLKKYQIFVKTKKIDSSYSLLPISFLPLVNRRENVARFKLTD
ncbi:hypothetical protein DB42_AQ00140 [Neochlamydia sp. EPS4]|uniref:F-box-like domain-containing protein n=1 Tax=Neochlamydia sp. EPS4 TaxID=1478175 RepID=UPI00058307EF|nr:F-box-like domain-containing protein [Neochlamydia sp. EPS4]KIC75034.1 hypothetical protein DB42_AQ00140 [Neochlamydia sp. EPS4]